MSTTFLPVGFRFHPRDDELLSHYLCNKVNGHPPAFFVMPEADVYAEEPWDIWERLGEQVDDDGSLYFFTIPRKVNPKGKRIDRRTKSRLGTWSEGEPSKPVCDVEDGKRIGTKRKFRWESEQPLHHAAWIMEEYSSQFSPDWVVCHLRKNKRDSNKSSDTSKSTGVKCIKAKNNKRSRTEDHQQVVEQQFTIDEIFPSTADRGNFLPFSDIDVIDLDNLLNYNGEDLQQSSTNGTDQQTNVATNSDIVGGHDHGNVIPHHDADGVDANYWDNLLNFSPEDQWMSNGLTPELDIVGLPI